MAVSRPTYDPVPGMLVRAKKDFADIFRGPDWEAVCPNGFEKGRIYTIREANLQLPGADEEIVYIRLVELVNPVSFFPGPRMWFECPFVAQCFHPVDPARLSIFRSMLTPVRESEAA